MSQSGEVPRGFRLRDRERSHDVADAQLPVVEQEPQHLEPSLVGENLEELGGVSHGCLRLDYIRIAGCTVDVKDDIGGEREGSRIGALTALTGWGSR